MSDALYTPQFVPSLPPLPAAWWRCAASLPLLVRIDARRPASWLAVLAGSVAAAATIAGTSADPFHRSLASVLAGALAAVAAIGDLPVDPRGAIAGGRRRGAAAWGCVRAAWPLAGAVAGAAGAAALGEASPVAAASCLAGLLLGVVAATFVVLVCRLAGAKAADAASLTVLMAAASAAAPLGGALLQSTAQPDGDVRTAAAAVGLAAAAWLLLGVVAWLWAWARAAADPFTGPSAAPVSDVLHLDPLPANGPLRESLTRIAMASMLAAMAGWLVSQVEQVGPHPGLDRAAVAWGLLSAAWFIGLVVPQALLQDGMAGAAGWGRLFSTAARAVRSTGKPSAPVGRPGLRAWLTRGPRLGYARFAAGVALSQAAILGWPPLVCGVLAVAAPERALPPLAIVAGLALAAGFVTGAAALGNAIAAARETVFAATLTVVVGVSSLLVPLAAAALTRDDNQPALPSLPSLVPGDSSRAAAAADDPSVGQR